MKYIYSLLFLFSFLHCHANDNLETVEISMLTVNSGDELYSTFGHTAIRLYDTETKRSQVYNYGTFDTETEGFYIKFLQGKLPYKLALQSYESFLRENNNRKRSVWEQKLDLTNAQKDEVLKFLSVNLQPENVEYSYDFFFDNCSTRAYDVFGQLDLEYKGEVEDITLRQMLRTHLLGKPFEAFGIDLVIGSLADKPTTFRHQLFLPLFLHRFLNKTNIGGKPLVENDRKILIFDEEEYERDRPLPNFPFYLGFFFIVLRIIMTGSDIGAKVYDYIWLTIGAIMSIIMMVMWFLTDHQSCADNWNLLWASPLIIVFIFVNQKFKRILAIPLLLMFIVAIANSYTQFLPQYFNLAIVPLCLIFGWAVIKRSYLFDYKK